MLAIVFARVYGSLNFVRVACHRCLFQVEWERRSFFYSLLVFVMVAWMTDRIVVVPLDMSEFSLHALETARDMVNDVSNVQIVHVLPTIDRTTINYEHRNDQTRAAMSAFIQEHGYPKMDIAIREGEPVKQIVQFAEECNAGLIVMPSHGRGMLTEMLLGSTTYSVVRRAHCPVLVLKPKK
jgi:nucleotide-binding universal stress UspA family protein